MSRLAQGRSGQGPHSQPAVGLSVSVSESALELGWDWVVALGLVSGCQSGLGLVKVSYY